MRQELKEKIILIAKEKMLKNDPSHDINHALRVLRNAQYIATQEKADLEVVIPSAIFHDIVCYPKNHAKSKFSTLESADLAANIL